MANEDSRAFMYIAIGIAALILSMSACTTLTAIADKLAVEAAKEKEK